jgi:hypothetical protein
MTIGLKIVIVNSIIAVLCSQCIVFACFPWLVSKKLIIEVGKIIQFRTKPSRFMYEEIQKLRFFPACPVRSAVGQGILSPDDMLTRQNGTAGRECHSGYSEWYEGSNLQIVKVAERYKSTACCPLYILLVLVIAAFK